MGVVQGGGGAIGLWYRQRRNFDSDASETWGEVEKKGVSLRWVMFAHHHASINHSEDQASQSGRTISCVCVCECKDLQKAIFPISVGRGPSWQ